MKKKWYESKTVQGSGVLAISLFLSQTGWVPDNLVLELVKVASGFWTAYGVRDALG